MGKHKQSVDRVIREKLGVVLVKEVRSKVKQTNSYFTIKV
jgi:hypothetical protein